MGKKKDLTGQKFGRLTAVEEMEKNSSRQIVWRCKCNCKEKNEVIVAGANLIRGHTKSCGCLKKETASKNLSTHGQSKTRTYKCWENMIQRCYNPKATKHELYERKRIKVCERWLYSFENFLEDMGEIPKDKKSVDRINPNKDYEPGNCKWATYLEQAQNVRGKGVYWDKRKQKWVAKIGVERKEIFLGYFDTPKEARQAYIKAKWKYHGIWLDE